MDLANEANKMFIIWLCLLFRFWKGDRELEVRTATYGPRSWSITAREISQPYNNYNYLIWYNYMSSIFGSTHCSIVATPGRFLHVVMEMDLKLKSMEYVVFDEADR